MIINETRCQQMALAQSPYSYGTPSASVPSPAFNLFPFGVFAEIEYLDTELINVMDVDLWVKLSQRGEIILIFR